MNTKHGAYRRLHCWIGVYGAAVVSLLAPDGASAAAVFIQNPSFEEPAQAESLFTSGDVAGWFATPKSGVWRPAAGSMPQGPSDGLQVGYSNEAGLALSQVLGSVLTGGAFYALGVDVLSRIDCCFHVSTTLQLLTADDEILAQSTLGALNPGASTTLTATYLADPASPLLGKSLKIALIAGGGQSDWDNVRLDARVPDTEEGNRVPEPASVGLLGLGLVALGAVRRAHAPKPGRT